MWGRDQEGLSSFRLPLLSVGGLERAHSDRPPPGVDQGIPDWWIKIMILREVEMQLDRVLNPGLVSWAFSDAILCLWF